MITKKSLVGAGAVCGPRTGQPQTARRRLTWPKLKAVRLAFVFLAATVAATGGGDDDPALRGASPTPTFAPPSPTPTVSCLFEAGAMPDQTLPAGAPRGEQIPIDHIVFLMQENHSFDNYFGQLPAAGHTEVDGLPPGASNPDSDGSPISVYHEPKYCTSPDVSHSWTGSHRQYNDGRNDGFVITNNPGGGRALGYYEESDLPFYYALAKSFAMSDRYFCSLLGPTYPNRFFSLAGTSFGFVRNVSPAEVQPRTIFDLLDENHITWKIYYDDAPFAVIVRLTRARNQVRFAQFLADAAAGTLPQVSFVDPAFTELHGEQTDEHPDANVQFGQRFAASAINALLQSPQWPRSVLFWTYDEHGGFYDHVAPPSACVPDDFAPRLQAGEPVAAFDRYGFRVPFVAVSPYAKPGYVSHRIYDHTSILRFIETRFDLPALTRRDANADPMLDLFDFSNPRLLNPPELPEAVIDPEGERICRLVR